MQRSVKRLLLIDVLYVFYRSFFAFEKRPLFNKAGVETSVLFGFLNTLQQLLRYKSFTHLAAIADAPEQTFRERNYPLYKAQRKMMPDSLLAQIQAIELNFSKLGIPFLVSPGFEADDVIASLAQQVRNDPDWECFIFSADKDLLQVVDDSTFLLQISPVKTDGLISIDFQHVVQKWGVSPTQIKFLLALMGDSSDNVPGVTGIGKKTAQLLVQQHGSLSQIYENIHSLKPSLQKKLLDGKENALLSLSLVTLVENLDKLPLVDSLVPQKVNSQTLWEWLHQMDLHKMLQTFFISNDPLRLFSILDFLHPDSSMISCHPLPVMDVKKISSLSQMNLEKQPTLVLLSQDATSEIQLLLPQLKLLFVGNLHQFEDFFSAIQTILSPQTIIVTDNAKFWIQRLAQHAITPSWNFWDVLLAEYFLDSRKTNLSLEDAANLRLNVLSPWVDQSSHRSQIVFEIFQKQQEIFESASPLAKELLQTDFELTKVLVNMENTGVQIDSGALQTLSDAFIQEGSILQQQIFDMAGKSFNVSSPKQLQEILFSVLKIAPIKKKKTGFSTDNQTLEQLLTKHPIIAKIIRFRFLEKLRNTTTAALPLLVDPITQRIHTRYHQNVVATGRLSSSAPNLQNIPIRKPEGRAIRKTFIAPLHKKLVRLDYSQVELRILAHLSQDPILLQAFASNQDIHTQTAKILFPDVLDISQHERQVAKTINFSVIYGISAHSLAQDLKIYVDQAKQFIASYFQQHVHVQSYMNQVVELAKKHGFVETFYGRKRIIEDLKSRNDNLRKRAERMAFNSVMQGTASDIIKKAMIRIFNHLGPQNMVMQVHDELVFYLPADTANDQAKEIQNIMEDIPPFQNILQVEFSVSDHWGK